MELTSRAFEPGGKLPKRYGFDGERISPPLAWADVPERTRELALLLEDLDAREPRPYVLWIAYKIGPHEGGLPEGIKYRIEPEVAGGIVHGTNSLGGTGYQAPGSPFGRRHRLLFHLYALESPMPNQPGLAAGAFHEAVERRKIDEATLAAFYVREER